jgi:hypothetical protein
MAKPRPTPPPSGLQCLYTCTDGGTEWELVCNEDTADECCDIADQACPYLVPGSTGVVSCIC